MKIKLWIAARWTGLERGNVSGNGKRVGAEDGYHQHPGRGSQRSKLNVNGKVNALMPQDGVAVNARSPPLIMKNGTRRRTSWKFIWILCDVLGPRHTSISISHIFISRCAARIRSTTHACVILCPASRCCHFFGQPNRLFSSTCKLGHPHKKCTLSEYKSAEQIGKHSIIWVNYVLRKLLSFQTYTIKDKCVIIYFLKVKYINI